jgi:anti-sigma-K factor RskA
VNAQELVAAYVLGELEGTELAGFEQRLSQEPGLRAEVDQTRLTLGALEDLPSEAWPQSAPPAAQRESRSAARRWSLRPSFALAALLVAVVIGGGIGALIAGGGSSQGVQPTALVLHPLDAPADSQASISMPKPETMLLQVRGLPPSQSGQYYEVWLMSNATETVPVASFRVGSGGTATVEVPLPADPNEYRYFDVSRQSVSAGTAHSTDSVLRGPTKSS